MIEREQFSLARVSWGAIIAGAILALAIQFMLGLLGAGIGLVSANPEEGMNFNALGWGTIIWMALTFFAALFIGGFVASRLSSNIQNFAGTLNSLVVWALVVGLNFAIAGSGFSKVATSLNNTVGLITSKVNVNAPIQEITNIDFQRMEQEITQLLEETDNEELKSLVKQEYQDIKNAAQSAATDILSRPGNFQQIVDQFISKAEQSLQQINQEVDREDIAQALSEKTDMSQQEAMAATDRWKNRIETWSQNFQTQLQEAKQGALKQAQQATDTAGSVALYAFFTLLLGLIATAFGGRLGTVRAKREYRK
ncbi:MAG: hypothetical protein CME64_08420 [Halobacteriovoraceae bacterium]|nr:hypothetical protein [Halobacteriovoraceae bacterium]|tara:strand:+ start:224801 stop:225730 length:930 start_codon:yes stop_codon:yes gene_type:complete